MPAQTSRATSTSLSCPPGLRQGRFTCVVDGHPRFHLEALRWYASLTANAGVDASDLFVYAVGSTSSEVLDYLRSQGVAVRRVDPFDSRSPHCNKISGALHLAEEGVDGLAVLCDTDVAILEDPRGIDVPADGVAGKVVDAPLPPLDVLLDVFAAAGLPAPPTVALPWGPDQWTVTGNYNGGLYLVPGLLLPRLATAWAHWAHWILDRIGLLKEWGVHVDQVAMALALSSEHIASVPLDVRWNTPTHDPSRIPSDPPQPAAIHYHWEVDRRGLIRSTGAVAIDRQIGMANEAVREVWTNAAPEGTFSAWLSERPSEPFDDDLKTTVLTLVDAVEPANVIDVGADSGLDRHPAIGHYTGVESAKEALHSLARNASEADLVLCLELLTYPLEAQAYQDLVELLWRSTRRALVVRGYDDPSGTLSAGFEFSAEPLSETLRRIAPEAEIYPVQARGALATFAVIRAPENKHPRDFPAATLAPLIQRHPEPLSLLTLRMHALGTTRFYPDHAPRLWEYPTVARLVSEHLPPGSRLADVGAGVTPLAPFLTSRGYVLETVDPSRSIRTWPPGPDWNEWDFLDYAAIGLAHRSWNCMFDQLPVSPPFDGVYSVSVIEHVPAAARRGLLADISERTRPGGLVVLTIDLVRGSNELWNLNLGVEVEELAEHGSLQDVVDECAAVGLELFREEVVRDWGDTRVDIGLLALRQTGVRAKEPTPIPSTSGWRTTSRRLLARARVARGRSQP